MVRRGPASRVLFWLMRFSRLVATVLLVAAARPLVSQTPSQAAAPSPIEMSGLFFGSFNMRTDSAARAALGGKRPSAFSIDRIYLNFRAPAGDNGALRVTT